MVAVIIMSPLNTFVSDEAQAPLPNMNKQPDLM